MDQLKRIFEALTWKQIVAILVTAGAVVLGLTMLSRWNRDRDFRPLYSDLSTEDAAAVLAKVREAGSDFRLSGNGSVVMVPSAKVAELRLQLAAAGVPKSGHIGFELFDKTNFGASDFTEQVNYHRALEGELERSVISLSEVEQARVHVTLAKESVFLESRQSAKASVLVKLRPGARLSPQNVAAICQLIASAVEGLAPEAVSVLDTRGDLLNRGRKAGADDSEPSEAALDYRQKVEHDLLAKINGTLDPLLGPDKFRTAVSVECDFSTAEQSEETFDPTKSVMVSSQKTEDISGGTSSSGIPGTPSNLPRAASPPVARNNGITRRTESINYQSSHTIRHVRVPQGSVKRMSVSLLVDSAVRYEGAGPKTQRIVEAPSAEKLKTIHDLVAGVIGFSSERGDQLVVETMPFESTLNPEPLALVSAPATPRSSDWVQLALKSKYLAAAGGVSVVILLMLGVLVYRLARRKPSSPVEIPTRLEGATEGDFEQKMESQLAEQAALRAKQETAALNALKLPPVTKKAEVLTKHISEQAKRDSSPMAHVLRSWMSENAPKT